MSASTNHPPIVRAWPHEFPLVLLRATGSIGIAIGISWLCFRASLSLPAVVPIQLLVIVLIAHRWGLLQSSIASLAAFLCLDYFFIPPLYKFSVAASADWLSLLAFEATALLITALSARERRHAAEAEEQRSRTALLYELSQAILLIDHQQLKGSALAEAIRPVVAAETVYVWDVYNAEPSDSDPDHRLAAETFRNDASQDLRQEGISTRVLRLGETPIGALVLRGWAVDPLTADAVASLAALAVERSRALAKEARAEAAKETEQLRTAVLDGLAHGFKTPLTVILTASSGLLTIGSLSDAQSELVTLIDDEAQSLNKLTNRLLRTAALESRQVRLNPATFDLAAWLGEIRDAEKPSVRDRIAITVEPGAEVLHADANLMRLALAQLIDNAAKYSRVASGIVIRAQQHAAEMVLTVENEGSFVAKEEREKIFERFYRGSDAAHGPAGTGLGLAIVKKAVEAHRGSVHVESMDGRTIFSIALPHPARRHHD